MILNLKKLIMQKFLVRQKKTTRKLEKVSCIKNELIIN